MKWYIAKFITVLLLIGTMSYYIGSHWNEMTELPTQKDFPLNNMSEAVTDMKHHYYIIGDSKRSILMLDDSGKLIYKIEEPGDQGHLNNFNDLAVDSKGYLYALNTIMDSYGVTVQSEQIVRYTPDGTFDRVIKQIDYYNNGESQKLHVGSIKSFQMRNDRLYYFIYFNNQVTLYSISFEESKPSLVYSAEIPPDKYLSEIYGFDPGSIYYSSRKGGVNRLIQEGQSQLIYPLDGMDNITRRNFPESLRVDASNREYFIDYYGKSINRLNPAAPNRVESLLNQDQIKSQGFDFTFFDINSISVTTDGKVVIVTSDQILHLDNGKIDLALSKAVYSSSYMQVKWLVWSLAALAVLLLLYALSILYFGIMKRRISLILKQLFIFVPIIVGSMVILSIFVYTNFSNKMEEETLKELSLLAHNGQLIIDGDKLEKMSSPLDYMNADYQTFKQKINLLFAGTDNDGFYKALYKYEDHVLYRMIEDDNNVNMFRPFPTTDENRLVEEKGEIVTNQWVDETGHWMYALGPIYNSKGAIVGIFETSKNLEGIVQHRKVMLRGIIEGIVIITGVILLLFFIVTYFLLSSIRKLRKSVIEIAKGNWNTVATINTRDEVADLGDQFNIMSRHIRNYIAEITDSSESYYRFVPQQFLKYLGKETILDVELGDQVEKEMNILVCNIRSFYLISKRMSPEENFNFINSFLNRFGPYVRGHGGLINKYLGAGIMALFPNASEEAITAAIEMRTELELYNTHRDNSNYIFIDIGIAIHKGPLRLGIIGEEKRLEGNVISDDVNLTDVLEKLTETLGVSILITQDVLLAMKSPEQFQYRSLGLITRDGQDLPIQLYDIYQGDPETIRVLKDRTKLLFEEGIQLYQVGRFYDAREAFLDVIKMNRQDKAAKLYFYLCDEYFQNGTTEAWNGTLSVS